MAIEYIRLQGDSDNGLAMMSLDSIRDIVYFAVSKVKGIVLPKKPLDLVDLKVKEDKLSVNLNVKLLQNLDIAKTCETIQENVYRTVLEMTNIKCEDINIDICGFISDKD